MNSKRERIDSVIGNLFIAKKSKLRQVEIVKSRKAKSNEDKEKNKDVMPKKIATEKWSKGKKNVSSGPGYFQTGKSFKTFKSYSASRPKKGWEKLPIVSNGGEYHPASGESIYLSNTCTIDNFFQFFLVHYSMNINQMSNLFESDDPIVGNICNIVQFLLNHDIDIAKYYWLTDICGMVPDMHKRSLSAFGTDKQIFLYPITAIFSRTYNFTCSSDKCPAGSGSADNISDMTLHPPPPPPQRR